MCNRCLQYGGYLEKVLSQPGLDHPAWPTLSLSYTQMMLDCHLPILTMGTSFFSTLRFTRALGWDII